MSVFAFQVSQHCLHVLDTRVDAVQLNVRGHAFDMTPFAKDHVARFEVK